MVIGGSFRGTEFSAADVPGGPDLEGTNYRTTGLAWAQTSREVDA